MEWLLEDWSILWHAAVTAIALLIVTIIIVRINGLRSFAKMSSIDFVTTISIGSVISSTIMSKSNSITKGALVVLILLFFQSLFTKLKMRLNWFEDVIENKPILLMKDGEFLDQNLASANVHRSDVIAKLREANALQLDKVHAVVLETTGDISVLHGDNKPNPKSILYNDVRTH